MPLKKNRWIFQQKSGGKNKMFCFKEREREIREKRRTSNDIKMKLVTILKKKWGTGSARPHTTEASGHLQVGGSCAWSPIITTCFAPRVIRTTPLLHSTYGNQEWNGLKQPNINPLFCLCTAWQWDAWDERGWLHRLGSFVDQNLHGPRSHYEWWCDDFRLGWTSIVISNQNNQSWLSFRTFGSGFSINGCNALYQTAVIFFSIFWHLMEFKLPNLLPSFYNPFFLSLPLCPLF